MPVINFVTKPSPKGKKHIIEKWERKEENGICISTPIGHYEDIEVNNEKYSNI